VFHVLKTFILFCLLHSILVQADTSWETQSSRYLEQLLISNPDRLPGLNEPAVVEFYQQRKYKPIWSDGEGRLDRAYDLLQVIIRAKDEGLEPADYYLEDFNRFWDSTGLGESVQLDLILSSALYRYASDVHSGRYKASELDPDWHIKNKPLDVSRLFTNAAKKSSITTLLKELPPQHSGYQSLKQQLLQLRELAQQGGWQRLGSGPVLKLGVQHEQVVQLRRRLELTGDLVLDPFPEMDVFDRWLEEAVMHYQARHGLEVDGKVGPNTRRSLNVAVNERIKQICINLERWRWLPRKLGKRYIMQNGSVVLDMPVIVGKSYRSTPTFSGLISYMVYNPYWTIPKKLVLEDIIPRQLRDDSYLTRKSIKVYRGWENPKTVDPKTVDWRKINPDRFPYWMRQDPGPKNALGRIKFLFSNPYEIYLHGTPDKHLFDRAVRAFSSGCIRVKDPVRLAAFLLNEGTQQMEEEVLENIHLGSNQGVTLPIAIPIYLVYWTAWVDQDGKMNFRDDIYDRDTRLNELFGS
jgi:murein L,D-transpeptidase YcbB/YkuD